MSNRNTNIAIVGATGAVGGELIRCLEHSRLAGATLRLFASERSAGRRLQYRGEPLVVEALSDAALGEADIALFSAGAATSRRFAPPAVAAGAVVIDNSSAFRMDADVPLIVPEVNPDALHGHRGLIANPNCVAIIAVVALWPLHRAFGLRRVLASTYQAVSGAGTAAMQELREATGAALAGRPYAQRVLRHPSAFNLFSHDTAIDPLTGANEEEIKVMRELRKIMQLPALPIGITCIRVPVLRAHAMSLTIECEQPVTAAAAREALAVAPGLRLVDDAVSNHFPMPIEASGQGDVLVGRLRRDSSDASGHSLSMFIAGDQLLKGAALNAVQIAERLQR